jgi:putative membrane protein
MTDPFNPHQLERPHSSLLKYYVIMSLLTGPGFLVVFWPMLFKYETLRYKFEGDGMSMSWGFLFRHEINLTYRRIQDIHLTRNLIQRWLGLATLSIQTASGSANPEMSIEGVLEAEKLRDFLYSKMRGARAMETVDVHAAAQREGEPRDETLELLREIRDLLRRRA